LLYTPYTRLRADIRHIWKIASLLSLFLVIVALSIAMDDTKTAFLTIRELKVKELEALIIEATKRLKKRQNKTGRWELDDRRVNEEGN